jgi:monofunctional biosynthetic peptidoglycan transglycosylase
MNQWSVVNDDVMGGVSGSQLDTEHHHLVFRGELSLENNGGFASARCSVGPLPADTNAVRIRIRGDGRSYQFRVRLDHSPDGIAWQAMLPASRDWQETELLLAEFKPVFRGRETPEAGPIDASQIGQAGFLLADATAGPFSLSIGLVEFFRAPQRTSE